jgi:small subunit ribosomal protein S6
MNFYETLYIINPNLAEEDYKDTLSKFSQVVEKNKGVLIKTEEWGKKTLAYPVKKFDKGYYVLLKYCGEAGITRELERDLKLDDRTIRCQTVKLQDHADPDALKRQVEEVAGTKAPESAESSDEVKGENTNGPEGE